MQTERKKHPSTSDSNEERHQSYLFPQGMEVGMIWPSVEKIKKAVAREIFDRNDPRLNGLYYMKYKPTKQDCQELRLQCKHCSAFLTFKITSRGYILNECMNDHNHKSESMFLVPERSHTQAAIFNEFRLAHQQKKPLDTIKYRIIDQYSLSFEQFVVLKTRFENEQLNDYANFKKYVKQHNFQIASDTQPPMNSQPRVMMLVSPTMKRSCQKYGDTMCFDIVSHLSVRNVPGIADYIVGVFYVPDCNTHPLIVAYVLMTQLTKQNMLKVMEFWLRLHRVYPESIMTQDNDMISDAIEQYQRHEWFAGVHLINSAGLLRQCQQTTDKNNESEKHLLDVFKKILDCRSKDEYSQYVQELEYADSHTQLIRALFRKRSKTLYWDIPVAFIGLHIRRYKTMADLLRQKVQPKKTLLQLITDLHKVETDLYEKSTSTFRYFKQPVDKIVNDQRVESVRATLGHKVFERFFDNYVKGMSQYRVKTLTKDPRTDTYLLDVECIRSGEVFRVHNWNCVCNEQLKTGLPCPHILCGARQIDSKRYLELIRQRWKKRHEKTPQELRKEVHLIE